MLAHPVDLDVTGYGVRHSSAQASVVHYNFMPRLLRGLERAVLVWVVAIPLMFIPFLAILVLPAAIGLSVYLIYSRMHAPDVARACKGTCPDCGFEQAFDLPLKFELPLDVECARCNRELRLEEHHFAN